MSALNRSPGTDADADAPTKVQAGQGKYRCIDEDGNMEVKQFTMLKPRTFTMDLAFDNLSLKLHSNDRMVLSGVTGELKAGRLLRSPNPDPCPTGRRGTSRR